MRQQLNLVFLFAQSKSAAKMWSEDLANENLMLATECELYEFVRYDRLNMKRKQPLKIERLPMAVASTVKAK